MLNVTATMFSRLCSLRVRRSYALVVMVTIVTGLCAVRQEQVFGDLTVLIIESVYFEVRAEAEEKLSIRHSTVMPL